MQNQQQNSVFLGLGSNLGNRENYISAALEEISFLSTTHLRLSSLYDTPPIGPSGQERYLNMCVGLTTRLTPESLLDFCKKTEIKIGRKKGPKWGPREIDIDILAYGNEIINIPGLEVPHPEIHQRQFILVPWSDIDGNFIHPSNGKPIKKILSECIIKYGREKINLYRSFKDIPYAHSA